MKYKRLGLFSKKGEFSRLLRASPCPICGRKLRYALCNSGACRSMTFRRSEVPATQAN